MHVQLAACVSGVAVQRSLLLINLSAQLSPALWIVFKVHTYILYTDYHCLSSP